MYAGLGISYLKMSVLYFIISCENLRFPLYSRLRQAVFSFVVVNIMCSFCFALFYTWEGSGLVLCNRRLELFWRTHCLIFLLFLLTGGVDSWMRDGTMLNTEK